MGSYSTSIRVIVIVHATFLQLFVHSQDQKICCSPCVELNDCKEADLRKEDAKNLQAIVCVSPLLN